jgi:hypothetical protein
MKEVGVHSNGESCMDAIDHYTSDTTTAHENPSAQTTSRGRPGLPVCSASRNTFRMHLT